MENNHSRLPTLRQQYYKALYHLFLSFFSPFLSFPFLSYPAFFIILPFHRVAPGILWLERTLVLWGWATREIRKRTCEV